MCDKSVNVGTYLWYFQSNVLIQIKLVIKKLDIFEIQMWSIYGGV